MKSSLFCSAMMKPIHDIFGGQIKIMLITRHIKPSLISFTKVQKPMLQDNSSLGGLHLVQFTSVQSLDSFQAETKISAVISLVNFQNDSCFHSECSWMKKVVILSDNSEFVQLVTTAKKSQLEINHVIQQSTEADQNKCRPPQQGVALFHYSSRVTIFFENCVS